MQAGRKYYTKNGWSNEQLAYMKWLCLPEKIRQPDTKTELAEELGCIVDTLRNWEKLPGWNIALRKMSARVLLEAEPVFFKTMMENMLKPSGAYERVNYFKIKRDLDYMALDGMLDEVAENTEIGSNLSPEEEYNLALEEIKGLPIAEQERILNLVRRLGAMRKEAMQNSPIEPISVFNPYNFNLDTQKEQGSDTDSGGAAPAPSGRKRQIFLLPEQDID